MISLFGLTCVPSRERGWHSGDCTHLPLAHSGCGLIGLLVLFSALRGFSLGSPVFPTPLKSTFPSSNLIRMMQNVPENHFHVSGASWGSIINYLGKCYFYYYVCGNCSGGRHASAVFLPPPPLPFLKNLHIY